MNIPFVSVIIPSYNRSHHIVKAICSVQSQSFQDFEIIIVDDGSRDGTDQIVAEKISKDRRIQYIKHPTNRGAQAARNTGIKSAQGEWIATLDSDDEYLPTSLETRLFEAENHSVMVVHSECFIEYTATKQRALFGIPPLAGMVYKDLLSKPGPMFQGLLTHASTLKEIDYLDESIVSYQEWDTSIRLSKKFEFGFVPEPTFIYHRHGDNTISDDSLGNAQGYEQIFRKNFVDIKRLTSRETLAAHYSTLAAYYLNAKEITLARRNAVLAIITRPSVRRIFKLRNYIY